MSLHPEIVVKLRVELESLENGLDPEKLLVVPYLGAVINDPQLYPEPNTFRPERFLERKYNVFEFLPFGGGHRRCMGAGPAEYSLRIALAEMVMNLNFESAGKDRDVRRNIAMGPKYGVRLRVQPRRK